MDVCVYLYINRLFITAALLFVLILFYLVYLFFLFPYV